MKEYKHDIFIPAKFIIGLDDDNSGFPSMKDEKGKWTNLSVFEKHCGFKPNTQKDARKEINKVLTQKVQEIDNVPTSGFKLVNVNYCGYSTDHFRDVQCATLQDPRGWNISIDVEVLQTLLESNGFNLNNGELVDVELMYCWKKYGYNSAPFSVTLANDKAKKIQAATEKYVSARDIIESIKPSELEIGKIYSSKTSKLSGNLYMYLGKHDVYSNELHMKAVMKENYNHLDKFINDRTDITGKDRYVFYCLDIPRKDSYEILRNTPGKSPYYVTGNVSKLFDTVEDVDITKYKMYNDNNKFCTYENIKADMAESALFNLVDLSKKPEYVLADYQTLEDVFGYFHGYDFPEGAFKAFPFSDNGSGINLRATNGSYTETGSNWYGSKYTAHREFTDFSISSYGSARDKEGGYFSVQTPTMRNSYDSSHEYVKYKFDGNIASAKAAFKKLVATIQPMYKQYIFCNGNKVPSHQNIQLNTKLRRYAD